MQLELVRKNSLAHRASSWLESLCYRCAWLVTGQSREILGDIQARFPHKRTYHLSNGVDIAKFPGGGLDTQASSLRSAPNNHVALYAGLHGLAQGLDQLIQAANALRDEAGLEIVLVGDGPEKQRLLEIAQRQRLENIRFLNSIPAENVPQMLASADILLITLKSYIPGAVPSKLYEAMASGKPVLLVASGEAAAIVEQHQAGIVVEPGDIPGLVNALRKLHADPELRRELGKNGRHAAEESFNREKIVASFLAFLEAHSEEQEPISTNPIPLFRILSISGLVLLATLVHFRYRWKH